MSKCGNPGPDSVQMQDDFEPDQDSALQHAMTRKQYTANVPFEAAGQRLDQVATEMFPEFSRAKLQNALKSGLLTINGVNAKPKSRVNGGESLALTVIPEPQGEWLPENIPLEIVFEDEDILVLNKPAGLVVHPAAGNYTGTLLNGLLHYQPSLAHVPRAGIVHRLDKDTSGLMVVAKNTQAQNSLITQLQDRSVTREYEAIALGVLSSGGSVAAPIGRHPTQRVKMAVVPGGRPAVTHYRPVEAFNGLTHLRLKLETGRTHQIRVHMAHIGFPLLGDPVYGRNIPTKLMRELPDSKAFTNFPRQALHAIQLGLMHPKLGEEHTWQIPLAQDMTELLKKLHSTSDDC